MLIKGIEKGDKSFRHFTFDDGDYVLKNGVYYYKVNYGKNKLEGEYAEDEISYLPVDKVIALGGRKPKPIPEREKPVTETVNVVVKDTGVVDKPKRGRPAKVKKLEESSETIPVAPGCEQGSMTYEYYVTDLKITDPQELQDGLNELGSQGWELCCYDVDRSLFSNTHIRMIFKRKRG